MNKEHPFIWFDWLFQTGHEKNAIATAAFVGLILITLGIIYRLSLKSIEEEIVPSTRFSLKNLMQVFVEGIASLVKSIVGSDYQRYVPLIGGLFVYLFINNLMGTFPGFLPATEDISANMACAFTIFFYYNFVGIKKQGFVNYFKHFLGPVGWLAPLLLIIELISHFVRPMTLSYRLFANIFGDHQVVGAFSDLVPIGIPVIFMGFGVFVAFIQAFVFSLLSSVYIGLAVETEDH